MLGPIFLNGIWLATLFVARFFLCSKPFIRRSKGVCAKVFFTKNKRKRKVIFFILYDFYFFKHKCNFFLRKEKMLGKKNGKMVIMYGRVATRPYPSRPYGRDYKLRFPFAPRTGRNLSLRNYNCGEISIANGNCHFRRDCKF